MSGGFIGYGGAGTQTLGAQNTNTLSTWIHDSVTTVLPQIKLGIDNAIMRFDKEEAECLAKELNEKHPNINHQTVISAAAVDEPPMLEPVQPRTDAPFRMASDPTW